MPAARRVILRPPFFGGRRIPAVFFELPASGSSLRTSRGKEFSSLADPFSCYYVVETAGFGVRQLAAALSCRELARWLANSMSIQGQRYGQQAGLVESGSKLPHSKALRASNIFRAEPH